MRTIALLLACPVLLVSSSCDGALGGDIHHQREVFNAASLETTPVDREAPHRGAGRPSRAADSAVVADTPEPSPDETGAEPPVSAPPPKPPESGGRSGGRGRGRGGKGSHIGTITVVEAGAGGAGSLGRVTGTVTFEGTPPPRTPLGLIAETAGCQAHEEMPLSEEVVVNDGKLQNVFVYLKSIPDDVTVPPPPTEAYELDQVGCQYVPHVVGIQAGRPIRAANSDAATHNVSCGGVYYPGGNRIIAAGSPPLQLPTPEREEIPIMFKCDIHPWMSAKVCVVEHPWFDVSAEDGTFTIADVPAGTYKIEAWQEKYGKARVSGGVIVGPGGHVQVDFNYKP